MAFCSKCGNQIEDTARFCNVCGAPVATAAPQNSGYSAPNQYSNPNQYQYSSPNQYSTYAPTPTYAQSEVSAGAKAKGFVGMGLAIGGLVFAILGLLYTFVGLAEEIGEVALGMAIGFGIFSMPLALVGRYLCNKSEEEGNFSGAVSAGMKLGIAGIIVSAVMFFFGFIGMMI